MRRYLLDTSPLGAFLLGRKRALETITPWIAKREVVTSIIVYGEIEEYFKTMSNYATLHDILTRQLEEIKPLSITRSIMEIYADLRLQMRAPRGSGVLTDSDTLIASTCQGIPARRGPFTTPPSTSPCAAGQSYMFVTVCGQRRPRASAS